MRYMDLSQTLSLGPPRKCYPDQTLRRLCPNTQSFATYEEGREEKEGKEELAVIMFVEFKQTSAVSKLHPQLPVS